MGLRSAVETITPEEATKILEQATENVQNRNVSDAHVEWLASQMRSGKWALNGEPIIFDTDGYLMDGQHRLWAITQAGVPVKVLVARGVDRKFFATIDSGAARTTGNVLSINGEKNANSLSAACGWLHRYQTGKMLWSLKRTGFTSSIALSLVRRNPTIRDAVEWSSAARKNPIMRAMPVSPLAFLRFMFVTYKPIRGAEFFDLVMDVRSDEGGTPTRVLRNWILTKNSARRVVAVTTLETMAVFVKAWAAFLNGAKPTKYLWRRTGKYPEDFPTFPGDSESSGKALKMVRRPPTKGMTG